MSSSADTRSKGMMFAENLLLKHGWEKGKGLGKKGHGMSEAIKVKVKCDNAGVGHSMGEQFTFHWWDHAFNRAASSIAVETSQSATLLSQSEEPEKVSENSDSSSEDEDEKLDLSSSRRLTDEELLRACGGLTAHKGARHGLNMNAKLARLEEQEKEFLAKYSKKAEVNYSKGLEQQPEDGKEKEKKKKSKEYVHLSFCHDSSWNGEKVNKVTNEEDNASTDKLSVKTKKNKREKMDEVSNATEGGVTVLEEESECKRKKKKKKHKRDETENFTESGTELRTASPEIKRKNYHREELTGSEAECDINSCKIKKKKKRKLKHVVE
ncbi:G patch domain-containing protein 4 isoform X3 [Protopterus annectens]|uniref:G patch domain-containing protein 4 isoform X3 n=1 Tax=Protopterus annectens TaxID=7888 RepID=UPI001CFA9EA4|nr:G patch domain-containing protein 4 isoform X3 [Protopterus annectens]